MLQRVKERTAKSRLRFGAKPNPKRKQCSHWSLWATAAPNNAPRKWATKANILPQWASASPSNGNLTGSDVRLTNI